MVSKNGVKQVLEGDNIVFSTFINGKKVGEGLYRGPKDRDIV